MFEEDIAELLLISKTSEEGKVYIPFRAAHSNVEAPARL